MKEEFDINLTPEDMYHFNMHHIYTSFQGISSIVIGILIMGIAIASMKNTDVPSTILYLFVGAFIILYNPLTLKGRTRRQFQKNEILSHTLHFTIDEEGIQTSQGEQTAELPWKQMYRVVKTKHSVLVYSTRINAYVLPLNQIGNHYEGFKKIAEMQLEKHRIKM